jgi:hypothetical protein
MHIARVTARSNAHRQQLKDLVGANDSRKDLIP